jgi:8-oxo-dGTP diphosphatase
MLKKYNEKKKFMEKNVKVGVGVLVRDKEGKVVLIKRTGSHGEGTWAPPGGHIDFGETAVEAGRREVEEETGIGTGDLKVLGFTEDFFEKEGKHYLTVWLEGSWLSGKLKKSDREFTEIGLFVMNNLPQPLFLTFKNFIEGKLFPRADRT